MAECDVMTIRDWLNLGLRMNWSIFAPGWKDFSPEDEYPKNEQQAAVPLAGIELTEADKKKRDQFYKERGGHTAHWLSRPLDLSTDAPDGEYEVEYGYVVSSGVEPVYPDDYDPNEFPPSKMPLNLDEMYPKQTVVKHGVVVKDGQFDPIPTAIACYQCVLHSYMHADPNKGNGAIDHSYIERLEWDGERFQLHTGS